MSSQQLGMLLIALGAGVVIVGVLVMSGAFHWFGRLPGDIRIQRDGFRLYAPIASMLLISAVLTLLMWIFRRGR